MIPTVPVSGASKHAVTVVGTYRTLLRLIKLLPRRDERSEGRNKLQQSYKANTNVTDIKEIQRLIKEAGERIAFLRM